MPEPGPIKRKILIQLLKQCGFLGPYSGGKHQFMIKGDLTLRLPNPHNDDISKDLLARILKQAHLSKDAWKEL
jgi:predicted RNA binding protein YcfA (HicA-like mRNA interferase family)